MRRPALLALAPQRELARTALALIACAVSASATATASVSCAGPRTRAADLHDRRTPPAACPRDSAPDATGRCACVEGTLALLGACVPPSAGDAYCGPAARLGKDGCEFKRCGGRAGETDRDHAPDAPLDLGTGRCVPTWLDGAGTAPADCGPRAAIVVTGGTRACVPSDAACPRGAARSGGVCVRGQPCPAGSLRDLRDDGASTGDACRPVVFAAGRGSGTPPHVVDVGAWVALSLGFDGGRASAALCRPLEQQAPVFDAVGSPRGTLRVRIALTFPNEDVTRVAAEVEARDAQGQPLRGNAARVVTNAVDTMVEALRSLGGEASATSVHAEVSCELGLPVAGDAGTPGVQNNKANPPDTDGDEGPTDGSPTSTD